jgi:hypothetical protein
MEGVDIPRLPVGTPVKKVGGYPFPGTVVAAFRTLSGQERFVVEATGEAYAGMLHIFNGGQLRAAPVPHVATREQQIVAMSKVLESCPWFNAADGIGIKPLVWATKLWEAANTPAPSTREVGGND